MSGLGDVTGRRHAASSSSSSNLESSRRAAKTQGFRSGRDPRPNDIFIAVMGVTGAGKSSFIRLASGNKNVKIGHSLESCTSTVEVHAWDVTPDRTIFLIDTPGFDDTNRSDTQVLRDIARWMGSSYQNRILLHGIIYLHRISDARMQGSAKKNLLMFKKLCGQDALKRVILVTTMWDRVAAADGESREEELITTPEFWGYMIGNGSKCRRHLNTVQTAQAIIHKLARHRSTVTTNLQKELVDENRSLDKTSAGLELESEIRKEREIWAKKLKETESEMRAAIRERDREAEHAIREERDRYTRMIKEAEKKTGSLRYTMENLLKERDDRVAALEKRLQKQEAARDKEMKELEQRTKRLKLEKAELEAQMAEEKRKRREQQAKKAVQSAAPTPSVSKPIKPVATSTAKTSTSPTRAAKYPPYSVSLVSSSFVTVSPARIHSNTTYPTRVDGNRYLQHAALGVHSDSVPWIARYAENGKDGCKTWTSSTNFMQAYPRLEAQIDAFGLNNLEYCVLGPQSRYYARWLDGKWRSWMNFGDIVQEVHEGSNTIYALGFGYGDSYCLSYGAPGNTKSLGYKYNLHGHYPSLSQFFVDYKNRNISIQAVTLHPTSTTDFIVVYCLDGDDSTFSVKWHISDEGLWKGVSDWWDKTCGR